ncbi:enoyl-CoA hydratase [Paracoccus sp. (in: a-proteobacteria)]|uniref:enoyl-CoA hydratase n=1 Tax=Paracoccus sp. TaxID=267 RepID=UPI00396CF139
MDLLLIREDRGPVARLRLNSPASFNALSLDMIEALLVALDDIARDDRVRVVTIAASGKAFSAGHDLRQMQAMRNTPDKGEAELRHLFSRCADLMQALPALPQPVIAEVQGIATAAGCQLVASCDLAIAAENAKFGVNGISIGLFCSTPMVALTRAVPPKAAFEMLMTGDFITATRAEALGLVNRVVPGTELEAETQRLADSIASKLPAAIRLGKRAFHQQAGQELAAAYGLTGDAMCRNMLLDDTAEGIAAFLEKRAPSWS